MKNIALIGVGALGKRHLQSLMELKDYANLYAVENNSDVFQLLKKEFPQSVTFLKDIKDLPKEIELVVIATSSNVRRTLFEQLINHSTINYLIFEKVLFQKEEDYYFVEEKLKELGIKAWTNCARREWDSYHWLKEKLSSSKEFVYSYIGGQWGLGCNGIHILDIIQFLAGGEPDNMNSSYLQSGVFPSKRNGFYEFCGTITGTCGKCSYFQLTCLKEPIPARIEIVADTLHVRINESHQIISIAEKVNNWAWEEFLFLQQYQSQMTGRIAKSILETGNCRLADYKTSMKLHLCFIKPLLQYFEKEGMEAGLCPIT